MTSSGFTICRSQVPTIHAGGVNEQSRRITYIYYYGNSTRKIARSSKCEPALLLDFLMVSVGWNFSDRLKAEQMYTSREIFTVGTGADRLHDLVLSARRAGWN